MVILTYVNDKKYGYLCSYASDPDYILPELKKLVLDEALDTVDMCGTGNNKGSECEFTGQFVLVETFLNLLGVEDMLIKNKWMEDAGAAAVPRVAISLEQLADGFYSLSHSAF
ncbi:hypothetical protein JG688_00017855 [Phytophthora aleatoria]|uniref:Uncharacterized protein n=1 Tax=Phytophthora aleatoria TaxID=2496075 RepID=A0A8J5MBW3_9STRA|nr:hypothetical protein JG688_00017855 [Phytophthora aleatoria]